MIDTPPSDPDTIDREFNYLGLDYDLNIVVISKDFISSLPIGELSVGLNLKDAAIVVDEKGAVIQYVPRLLSHVTCTFRHHQLEELRALLIPVSDSVSEKSLISAYLIFPGFSHSAHENKLKVVGTFVSSIAHDLNNLLMAVLGHLSYAKSLNDPTTINSSIEAAEGGARRAAELSKQILNFGRKHEQTCTKIDLCAVIKESVALISGSLPEIVALKVLIQEDCILARINESQFTQILLNLITNARDAMPDGGTITVRLKTRWIKSSVEINGCNLLPGAYALMEFQDEGTGIAEEIKKKVFKPFFTTKKGTGTGLGLATVFSTVRALGGAVELKSPEGGGAVFEILIPMSELQVAGVQGVLPKIDPDVQRGKHVRKELSGAPSKGQQAQGQVSRTKAPLAYRILVVDDEDSVRVVLQRSLELLGYEVDAAEDGDSALELFNSKPTAYSLVILDMIMPGISGDELFFLLKGLNPDIRVLIASGYSADGKTQMLLENGAVGYLQKPFAIEELQAEVHRCLGNCMAE